MTQHLIRVDERALGHCQAVLARYLPGLDPGLVALGPRSALVLGATLTALARQYGSAGRGAILREAGVIEDSAVGPGDALALLAERDPATLPARATPPLDSRLWHLDAVRARDAWNHWGGPEAIDWGDVRVGQIDTGYTRHPALGFPGQPTLAVADGRTFYAVGEDGAGPGPGQGIDPNQTLMDGHGTRVATVIGGHDPAVGGGTYYGVAPRVPLVPVRIANIVLISHAQRELAQALRYLVQDAKVSVINLSMGFLPPTQIGALDRAIDEAYMAGVIFVCAAGQPLPSVVSPARGRRTIAVAGSVRGDAPWGQSAFGPTVDWSAPAQQIFRGETRRDGSFAYAGDGDGTSYAAAATSGAAALWLARHGAAIPAAYAQRWQRIEAFKRLAKATARPMPHQQPGSFGAGILDIAALLASPLPPAGELVAEGPA